MSVDSIQIEYSPYLPILLPYCARYRSIGFQIGARDDTNQTKSAKSATAQVSYFFKNSSDNAAINQKNRKFVF